MSKVTNHPQKLVAFEEQAQKAVQEAQLAEAKAILFRYRASLCEQAQAVRSDTEKIMSEMTAKREDIEKQIVDIDNKIVEVDKGQIPANMPELTVAAMPKRGRPVGVKAKKAGRPAKAKKAGRPAKAKKAGRPAKVKATKRGRPLHTSRAHNELPLRQVVTNVLKGAKNGLNLTELVEAIVKTGYKSKTKDDFAKIVYQAVYKLCKEKTATKEAATKKYRLVA